MKQHLGARAGLEFIKTEAVTALWSEYATGSKITFAILQKKPLEEKNKSIQEKDLCLEDKCVNPVKSGFETRQRSNTPIQDRKALEAYFCVF